MTAACGVAKEMEKRFGIPYMADIIPIGFGNSAAWLERVAGFFKIDAGPYLKETMANAFEFISSNMVFTVTFEMTAALSLKMPTPMPWASANFSIRKSALVLS